MSRDKHKRALLLHVSGEEVQDLFKTLTHTGTTYAQAIDKINEYFAPKKILRSNVTCSDNQNKKKTKQWTII